MLSRRFCLSLLASACLLAPALKAEEPSLTGSAWLAEDLLGQGVIDSLQTTLEIDRSGQVSGLAGCNRYRGSVTLEGQAVSFSPLAATLIACLPAVAEQEQRLFAALSQARRYRFETDLLFLLDGDDKTVARFSRLGR
ncbi:MAG: hypothetical protein Kilf2KO_16250 [Rhodospirillales bacterium]